MKMPFQLIHSSFHTLSLYDAVVNCWGAFTTREYGVVMRSVASVCVSLGVSVSVCPVQEPLTFENFDLKSLLCAGTSSEYLDQSWVAYKGHWVKIKITGEKGQIKFTE